MSDLVGNPEDQFSHKAAHLLQPLQVMLSVCLGKLELLKKVIQNTPREIKTLLQSIPTTIGQRNREKQKVRSHLFKINEVASQLFIKTSVMILQAQ